MRKPLLFLSCCFLLSSCSFLFPSRNYHYGTYEISEVKSETNDTLLLANFERYILNGQLDGEQTSYLNDTIMERVTFKNGKLINIHKSIFMDSVQLDKHGNGVLHVNKIYGFMSIISFQIKDKKPSFIRLSSLGDASFTGKIPYCSGLPCIGQFELQNELFQKIDTFNIEYQPIFRRID